MALETQQACVLAGSLVSDLAVSRSVKSIRWRVSHCLLSPVFEQA